MTDTATDGSGVVGQQGLNDDTSPYNLTTSFIQQALGRIATIKLVKVMAVTNAGELSPVGFVDVKPMVNLVDGVLGGSMQQDTVFGLPYFRLQGGKNAIIIDPVVGDVGFAVVCDRDISSAKENKDYANPSSHRRFSLSDGIYVGGVLNDTPEQVIVFKDGMIEVTTPIFKVNGKIQATDDISTTGEVTAKAGAGHVNLSTHRQQAGTSQPPIPGT